MTPLQNHRCRQSCADIKRDKGLHRKRDTKASGARDLSRRLDSASVDPFALVLLGGLAALILWIWLLGKYYPGSGLEQLGLRSAREITESREALDAEDLEQMLAAHNARRRARGESEVSVPDLELRVVQDVAEQQRRRDRYLADRELDQLLEATNARRRARGLPERTRAQAREEFGGGAPPPTPEMFGGGVPPPPES